jgi:hypothetical protein
VTGTTVSRRTVLGLLAGSGIGLLVGCGSGPSADERACGAVQASIPEAPAGLVAIGARYRQLFPDDDLTAVGRDLPEEPGAALAALSERVRADFAAGDTVDVDGWVLSRTEARAAAIVAGC